MKKVISFCLGIFAAIYVSAIPVCSPVNGVTISMDTNCYVIEVIPPLCYPNISLNEKILAEHTIYERVFNEVEFGFTPSEINPFSYTQWAGGPAIPFISLNLQIPEFANVESFVEYIEYDNDITLDYPYVPIQNPLETEDIDTIQYNENLYIGDFAIDYLSSPVTISEPYTYRETKGVNVKIKPFIYDAGHHILSPIREIRYIVCVSGNETLLAMYNNTIEQEGFGDAIDYYNTYCNDILVHPNDDKGNFLIITSPEYEYEAETYAQHKNNLGFDACVETYDPSYTTATDIRHFLKADFDYVPTRPRHVLIIGDQEEIPYSAGVSNNQNQPLTDIYYACLDNYDVEDEDMLIPDVFVGRWPINSHGDLNYIMNKSINYDLSIPEDRRISLFTGTGDSPDLTFASANKYVYNLIRDYVDHNTCVHYDGALGANSQTMFSEFTDNNDLMMVYRGHGAADRFGSPFSNVQIHNIPDNLPYFTFSIACQTGVPAGHGVHWVNEGGSSVAFYGATVNTYRRSNNELEMCIFDGLKDLRNYTIGELIYKGIGQYFLKNYPQNKYYADLEVRSYVLYGDPSLYIYGMEFPGYPVPYMPSRDWGTHEEIEESISNDEIVSYSIYTPLGIMINTGAGTKTDIKTAIENLETGLYVISVFDQNNQLICSNKVLINQK